MQQWSTNTKFRLVTAMHMQWPTTTSKYNEIDNTVVANKKSKKSNIITTFNSVIDTKDSKHKHNKINNTSGINKKSKNRSTLNSNFTYPVGLKWDNQSYSCPYDSLFGILYNIWKENPDKWTGDFENINGYMQALAYGFREVYKENVSLEDVRDNIRKDLHDLDTFKFPMGTSSASVAELAFTLMKSTNENAISQVYCTECDYPGTENSDQLQYVFNIEKSKVSSTQKWLDTLEMPCRQKCKECSNRLTHQIDYKEKPALLVLEYPGTNIKS